MRPAADSMRRVCSRNAPPAYSSRALRNTYSMPSASRPSSSSELMCSPYEPWHPPGSGTSETGLAMCSASDAGMPSGTLRSPSRSSEYAISSERWPASSSASFTPYARTASPRLPRWGTPEAPRPLSTLTISVSRPSRSSRRSTSAASLSIQVPRPIMPLPPPAAAAAAAAAAVMPPPRAGPSTCRARAARSRAGDSTRACRRR